MRRGLIAVTLMVAALTIAVPLVATEDEGGHAQAITANPFLLTLGWFNAEYERALGTTMTWGGSYSTISSPDPGGGGYRSAKAVWRYYTGGQALNGKWVGLRGGRSRLWDRHDADAYFLVGAEVGYSATLGHHERLILGIGAGASRLIDGPAYFPKLMPSVRVNLGVAW